MRLLHAWVSIISNTTYDSFTQNMTVSFFHNNIRNLLIWCIRCALGPCVWSQTSWVGFKIKSTSWLKSRSSRKGKETHQLAERWDKWCLATRGWLLDSGHLHLRGLPFPSSSGIVIITSSLSVLCNFEIPCTPKRRHHFIGCTLEFSSQQ